MPKEPNFDLDFQLVILSLEILDSFKLSMKYTGSPSRDHESIRTKLHDALISRETPLKKYQIFISRREAAYFRKVVFQYFIVLLKEGIVEDNSQYHKLYKILSDLLGKESDEIKSIQDRLRN